MDKTAIETENNMETAAPEAKSNSLWAFLKQGIAIYIGYTLISILVIYLAVQFFSSDPEMKIISMNEAYEENKEVINNAILSDDELDALNDAATEDSGDKPVVIVLDFYGDIQASGSKDLSQEIATVLSLDKEIKEVVVNIESPGGLVHEYGYAASQIERIRDKGIPLTACVNKVAASGGYMMASVANQIVAAPFAVVGSIGVVAGVPNINKLLSNMGIDYEEMTAGEHKRTVTVLGKNTEEGKEKFKEKMNDVHTLFKNHVAKHRPNLDIEKIANGDVWYGREALELGLIDEVKTCDQYIGDMSKTASIYKVTLEKKQTLAEKMGMAASVAVTAIFDKYYSTIHHF